MFINDCTMVEKTVVVQGTVVELSRPDPQLYPTRPISLALDDGTGVLKVAIFRNSSLPHLDKVEFASCLQVRGQLTTFRDQLQLRATTVKIVSDPNMQTVWINRVICENHGRNQSS